MKINKREKFLLVVLALLIIGVGYYKLVYENQYNKLQGLKEKEATLREEYIAMSNNIDAITKNKENIKILNFGIESKSMLLYPKLYQDRIILEVNTLLTKAEIKGNISFSETSIEPVLPYFSAEKVEKIQPSLKDLVEDLNKEQTKLGAEDTVKADGDGITEKSNSSKAASEELVEQMKVSVSFTGAYNNVMKFIELISEYDRLIAMPNITLTASGTDVVSGTIDLEFYSIPKLNDREDSKYLEWPYVDKYGKENPFIQGSATSNSLNKSSEEAYELVMSIRSVNSDLPSITIGRENDLTVETYIYNDENKKIDVEVEINKEGSKYFIKYKTSSSSYPSDYNEKGIELKNMEGDITIGVYSSTRTDINDKVSANIKVINNTDKNVSLNIVDDDSASPRVQITPEGKVEYVKR